MRRQLFAAGVAVALLVGGAASPAMAKSDKGKAKGHVNKPVKAPKAPKAPKAKKSKAGVSGGGEFATGSFSAQARVKQQPKGHFNYTEDGFKLRCRSFVPFADPVPMSFSGPVTIDFTNCETRTGVEPNEVRTKVGTVSVTFTDNGKPSATVKDSVTFSVGGVSYGGPLTDGNIKIR